MPTYVYKFVETGETIEVQQSFADDTLTEATHPRTGATMAVKKVFQPVGVTFKGDGLLQDRQPRHVVEHGEVTGKAKDEKSSTAKESSSSDSSSSSSSKSQGDLLGDAGFIRRLRRRARSRSATTSPTSGCSAELGITSSRRASQARPTRFTRSRSTRRTGAPAAPITVATVAGRRVAFLPRHGRGHRCRRPSRALPGQRVRRSRHSVCARSWRRARRRCASQPDARARRLRRRRPARRPGRGAGGTPSTTWAATSTRARACTTSRSPTRTTHGCGPRSSRPAAQSASRSTTAARWS